MREMTCYVGRGNDSDCVTRDNRLLRVTAQRYDRSTIQARNTVSPRFKPQALINFMAPNHPGSNQETIEIETLLIWMGKLTWVQFEIRAVFEEIR